MFQALEKEAHIYSGESPGKQRNEALRPPSFYLPVAAASFPSLRLWGDGEVREFHDDGERDPPAPEDLCAAFPQRSARVGGFGKSRGWVGWFGEKPWGRCGELFGDFGEVNLFVGVGFVGTLDPIPSILQDVVESLVSSSGLFFAMCFYVFTCWGPNIHTVFNVKKSVKHFLNQLYTYLAFLDTQDI